MLAPCYNCDDGIDGYGEPCPDCGGRCVVPHEPVGREKLCALEAALLTLTAAPAAPAGRPANGKTGLDIP